MPETREHPQPDLGSLERLGDSLAFNETLCNFLGRSSADPDALKRCLAAAGWGGYRLLEILGHAGWDVAITKAFAGEHVDELGGAHPALLIAIARDGLEFRATGPSVEAIAPDLFVDAIRCKRLLADRPTA